MTTPFDIPANSYIEALSKYLADNIDTVTPPPWARFIKTGVHAERTPTNENWWYLRCASILRKLYMNNFLGISRLRLEYGGRSTVKGRPKHFRRGSGAIIRKALQQLESAGLVTKVPKKGRTLTSEARSTMDKIAANLISESHGKTS